MRACLRGLGLLACCLGCGGADPHSWIAVPQLAVDTPDTVIEAERGTFRLVSGAPVRAPFWTHDCPIEPTIRNFGLAEYLGAQRVRVRHPATDETLYGLLSLCHVHPSVTGSVAQSYSIRVPDGYVHDTVAGGVSLVYEPYTFGVHELPAWALWLSRAPFPAPSRQVEPPGETSAPVGSRW